MVRLRCVGNYRRQEEVYHKGQIFEADDEHAAWLMQDAPGTFEVAPEPPPKPKRKRKPQTETKTRAIAKPPATTEAKPNTAPNETAV